MSRSDRDQKRSNALKTRWESPILNSFNYKRTRNRTNATVFVSKQRGTLSEPDSPLALPLYHNRQRRPSATSITGRSKQQVCSSELLRLQQVNAEAVGRSLLLFSPSKMRIPREKLGLGVFMAQKHQTLTPLWELRGKTGTQLAQKQATSDPSLNTPKG